MDKDISQAIVLHGLRWANKILVEILSNHARAVSREGTDKLSQAVSLLEEADTEFRKI